MVASTTSTNLKRQSSPSLCNLAFFESNKQFIQKRKAGQPCCFTCAKIQSTHRGNRLAFERQSITIMDKGREHKSITASTVHWASPYNPLDPRAPKLPTKGEMKTVIPKECFERSYTKGFLSVFRDVGMAAAPVFLAMRFLSLNPPSTMFCVEGLLWSMGWTLYSFLVGLAFSGFWELAHECGHGSLFPSNVLNDVIGFTLHHIVLTPYFSMKASHAKHHKRVGHSADDEGHTHSTCLDLGFDPSACRTRSSLLSAFHKSVVGLGGNTLFTALLIFLNCLFAFPFYLLGLHKTSKFKHDGSPLASGEVKDHFRPSSGLFHPKVQGKVALSTAAFFITLGFLAKLTCDHGFLAVFLWYLSPVLWQNANLAITVALQHYDPSVPVYGPDQWSWNRGVLSCTIDRSCGVLGFYNHGATTCHVLHHLFPEIPCYNAVKGTAALSFFLKPKGLYNYNPETWWKAVWHIFRTCHYIESRHGVQWPKSFF